LPADEINLRIEEKDRLMKIRVLVVDDEQSFAETLAERLKIRGFDVESLSSGEEAIKAVDEREYDIVVLDVLMPGKSGLETFREIRAKHPRVHVIMLTGHARPDMAITGMKEGAYDYLIKPVGIDDLVEKLELAYSHKKLSDARDSGAEQE